MSDKADRVTTIRELDLKAEKATLANVSRSVDSKASIAEVRQVEGAVAAALGQALCWAAPWMTRRIQAWAR